MRGGSNRSGWPLNGARPASEVGATCAGQLEALNCEQVRQDQSLRVYVGYREVAAARGVSRRTIERMVRAGTFPKPQRVSPGRVAWPIEVVNGAK